MFGRKFRTKEARKRMRLLRIIGLLGTGTTAVVLLCIVLVLLRQEHFRITTVEVHGASAVDPGALRATLLSAMDGAWFFLVPKDSLFFYPSSHMKESALHTHPQIKTITLERFSLRSLHATIQERAPHALWCGDIVPESSLSEAYSGVCYFLDEEGFLFAQAPQYEGTPYLRWFGAVSGGKDVAGHQFIETDDYRAITSFLHALVAADIPLYGVLVVDERDIEIYTSSGTRILVRRDDSYGRVLERLLTVLVPPDGKPLSLSNFAYLDLRFDTKVYLKEKVAPHTTQEGGAVIPRTTMDVE